MPDISRRERAILSAEKIFADVGFDRATMRTIADDADVKLALLTYHFTTKANLYREVFAAHQHLNEQRLTKLHEVDLESANALEGIVDAFLEIARQDPNDVRLQRYQRMVLREASDPLAYERGIMTEFFDPMAREFIAALRTVMPDRSPEFARWSYLFTVGALTTTNFGERERALADGDEASTHRLEFLRDFIIAGLRGTPPAH